MDFTPLVQASPNSLIIVLLINVIELYVIKIKKIYMTIISKGE